MIQIHYCMVQSCLLSLIMSDRNIEMVFRPVNNDNIEKSTIYKCNRVLFVSVLTRHLCVLDLRNKMLCLFVKFQKV